MFEIDSLAKAGLQGWPLVVALGIICVSFVAFWNGQWPWTGLINIHKHTHRRKRNEDENED